MHNLINVYVINYFLVGNMDYDVGGVYVKNCDSVTSTDSKYGG